MQCTAAERAILAICQDNLPASLTPYADIAAACNVTEAEVLELLQRMKASGAIRRFGATIRHQRTGWKHNAMLAWVATEAEAVQWAPVAATHPRISHIYFRPSSAPDWPYTLYTMTHGRSVEECAAVAQDLLAMWPLRSYANLRTLRELKKTSMIYFSRENNMDAKSRQLYAEACRLMPGGVNSPVRACKNVHAEPLFIDYARGSHIFDVDGREYIDYVLSWGPMLLGHADPDVTGALLKAVPAGTSYGAPCPAEVTLAQAVVDALPAIEMTRMVNSGTEATMSALRLARGVTKRNKVIKFIGCYHGHADPFLAAAGSGVATLSLPGTPGVPAAVVQDTILVQYNDLEAATAAFSQYGEDIAAVIVEPVAANMGLVLSLPGFLDGLRRLCDEYRALLIFDEVITGFRLDYAGAQGRFNIHPDLATFGKIIGGGLPVGCFGGKRELMEHVAPQGDIYQAGTLSGNPLAMAAGIATLQKLKTCNYAQLEKRVAKFAQELREVFAVKGIPVQIPAIASMFSIFFSNEPVVNFVQAKNCNQELFTKFYTQMRNQGIYLAPSAFETGMVSFAHSDADFEQTIAAAKKVSF